jgi:hypothetical protein
MSPASQGVAIGGVRRCDRPIVAAALVIVAPAWQLGRCRSRAAQIEPCRAGNRGRRKRAAVERCVPLAAGRIEERGQRLWQHSVQHADRGLVLTDSILELEEHRMDDEHRVFGPPLDWRGAQERVFERRRRQLVEPAATPRA